MTDNRERPGDADTSRGMAEMEGLDVVDSSGAPEPFTARYSSGRCPVCRSSIERGDVIIATDGGYRHEECTPRPERPIVRICGVCHLERPCPCEDGQ